jgi:hypothetical protein
MEMVYILARKRSKNSKKTQFYTAAPGGLESEKRIRTAYKFLACWKTRKFCPKLLVKFINAGARDKLSILSIQISFVMDKSDATLKVYCCGDVSREIWQPIRFRGQDSKLF